MRAAALTRGESIARQQAELYPRLAAAGAGRLLRCGRPPAGPARRATSPRPGPRGERRDETDLAGGGYERVALAVMRALAGGGAAELILNTVNTVPGPPEHRRVRRCRVPGAGGPGPLSRDCRRTPSSRFPAG